MKSVVELWQTCLYEAGELHCVRIHRDMQTAMSRIRDEGVSFLTITLPAFAKDLDQALCTGIDSNHFAGFRRRGGLPLFLRGFLCRIFDVDGSLRPNIDPSVVRTLRQILLLCSKVEANVTTSRLEAAIDAYVRTDEELFELPDRLLSIFRSASRSLLGDYFAECESRIWSGDWRPRHSTGALATRESANSRYSFRTWTDRLQSVLPWWDELCPFPSEIQDFDVSVLARDEEPPSRVAVVPKTMKGPRIIAMEPVHLQYVQQGILHVMTEVLQLPRFNHLYKVFGWLDQVPNRRLARYGSKDGSFATLDLSEASDRVSLELVNALLDSAPYLRNIILASRSQRALLPDGRVITLKKFASMGSSVCFPIESMVFYIISSIACAEALGVAPSTLPTTRSCEYRVYGDDLIVPVEAAQNLRYWLESFGLKVNARKTFTAGLFRESCGADWFQGHDVSVFKLRAPLPTKGRQYQLLDKGIEFHNRVYDAGWFSLASKVADHLYEVEKRLTCVPPGTDAHALWSWDGPYVVRTCRDLQRCEYKTLIFRQRKPSDPLDGYGAMKKVLWDDTSVMKKLRDRDHLHRDGRSQYVGVHIGWTRS